MAIGRVTQVGEAAELSAPSASGRWVTKLVVAAAIVVGYLVFGSGAAGALDIDSLLGGPPAAPATPVGQLLEPVVDPVVDVLEGQPTPVPALPPVSLPPVSLPPVSLPPVSLPPVSLPPVSLPPVSLPAVALPPVALPPVALPAVVQPVIEIVEPIVAPVADALEPVVAPVVAAVEPIVAPIVVAVEPVVAPAVAEVEPIVTPVVVPIVTPAVGVVGPPVIDAPATDSGIVAGPTARTVHGPTVGLVTDPVSAVPVTVEVESEAAIGTGVAVVSAAEVAVDAPAIDAPAVDAPVVGQRLVDELFAAAGEAIPEAVLGSGRAIERTTDGALLTPFPVPVAPVGSGSAGGVGSAAVQILVLAAFVIAAALLAQMHSSIVEHDSDALRSAAPLIPGFSPD